MKTTYAKEMISIVVPIYNTAPFLKRCIESIIKQTYTNLEIILVDDGSSDGSSEICDVYAQIDTRIKVIHRDNGGQSDARCSGIEIARGDYLGFVDSDDWIDSDMYEKLMSESQKYDLITSAILRHDKGEKVARVLTDSLSPKDYITTEELAYFFDNLLICECVADHVFTEGLLHSKCSKLFRMSIVREMYKDANISVTNGEDWLFCVLYALRCNSVKILHESYYHYMYNENSVSNNINLDFLKESNEFYLAVSRALSGHWMEKSLRVQFQKWFLYRMISLIPRFLQFIDEVDMLQYICPYMEQLKGKRIVLFGAGKVGRDYCRELMANNFNIVLWIDNNYFVEKYCGMDIYQPDRLLNIEYDYIVCAIFSKRRADEIRSQLIDMGIRKEKILWRKPYDFTKGLLVK